MIILYREPQGFVGLSYDDSHMIWVMHVELYQWSVSEYKRYLKIFSIIKKHVKELTPVVYSFCDTDKEMKFNELFGFEDLYMYAQEEDGNISKVGRLVL